MINYFSIALTHGLILVACWRLMLRSDLDKDGAVSPPPPRPWLQSQGECAVEVSHKASPDD